MAQEFVEDGTFDWTLGQDSWAYPTKVKPNQYHKGVNLSITGGGLSPRPKFHFQKLTFDTKENELIWKRGRFQCAIKYDKGDVPYILTVVSGVLFKTTVSTGYTERVPSTEVMSQFSPRINRSYADDKIVFFDYPSYPMIFDGQTLRRSDINKFYLGQFLTPEIPIANLGAYNQNRLFIANFGASFTAGDPVGNSATPEAPITFTEVLTPSSPFVNQILTLPDDNTLSQITAMGFLQSQDTSTGIGPMFVATRDKIFAYQTFLPRADWDKTRFGTMLINNAGIIGPRAYTNINSDLIFMSGEGFIRALSTATSDLRKWSNVPISREVQAYLHARHPELLKHTVITYHNNRVLIAANPYLTTCWTRDGKPSTDVAFAGMVVMEIDATASMLAEGAPAWVGLWTGVDPLEFVTIRNDLYIVAKEGNENALFKLVEGPGKDRREHTEESVRSIIYTKSYSFTGEETNTAFMYKHEHTVAMHLQELRGDIKLQIERKPSHAHNWSTVAEWSHCAPTCLNDVDVCEPFVALQSHNFRDLIFSEDSKQACSPLTNDLYSIFRACQYRITLEGEHWLLDNFKVRAQLFMHQERNDAMLCDSLPCVYVPFECDPDWNLPERSLCQT